MPWAADQARAHDHDVRSAIAARQWRDVANQGLKRGLPDGTAIREANGVIGHRLHRQTGGATIGGPAPTTQNANPMMQSLIQRFASMSPEQLQELAPRLGGSPLGQIANQVLNQKRMIPNAQPQMPAAGAPPPAQGGMGAPGPGAATGPATGPQQMQARGGATHGLAAGGSPLGVGMGMADPFWTRQESYGASRGLLASQIPGRTDKLPVSPAAESFVMPADVVSGLGEGNTLAGARALQEALATGPGGVPVPRGGRRGNAPRPPSPNSGAAYESKGGRTTHVPIAAAGGEFIVPPEAVQALGARYLGRIKSGPGSQHKGAADALALGHKLLHALVLHVRRRTIREMMKLKGPVKQ